MKDNMNSIQAILSSVLLRQDTGIDPRPMIDISATETPVQPTKQKEQRRCACCPKKLALTDFACGKCQIRHCAVHRLPEQHTCGHDFRTEGRKQLTDQLTKVAADRVSKI